MQRSAIRLGISTVLGMSLSAAAQAAPCVSGSVADYLALGATGCSVGAVQFRDFTLPAILGPATPVDAAVVTLAPLFTPTGVGLSLLSTLAAGAGSFLELRLGFNASVATGAITRARIDLGGASATGDGVTTLIEDLCVGSAFDDPGNLACIGSTSTLVTVATEGFTQDSDALDLAPEVKTLGVVADLGVDGGLGGASTFTAGTLLFSTVPLPSTLALLGLGALGLGTLTRKRPQGALQVA